METIELSVDPVWYAGMVSAEARMRKLSKFKAGDAIQYKESNEARGEGNDDGELLVVSVGVSVVRSTPVADVTPDDPGPVSSADKAGPTESGGSLETLAPPHPLNDDDVLSGRGGSLSALESDYPSPFAAIVRFQVPANDPIAMVFRYQYKMFGQETGSWPRRHATGMVVLTIVVVFIVAAIITLSLSFQGGHPFGVENEAISKSQSKISRDDYDYDASQDSHYASGDLSRVPARSHYAAPPARTELVPLITSAASIGIEYGGDDDDDDDTSVLFSKTAKK